MPGTTDREPKTYRRQDDGFVWVRNTAFTVWSTVSVSGSELQATEKAVWCAAQPTKSSEIYLYSDTLVHVAVPCQDFTTVLRSYRAGVLKRRYGEIF